jgi:hypothetical protein
VQKKFPAAGVFQAQQRLDAPAAIGLEVEPAVLPGVGQRAGFQVGPVEVGFDVVPQPIDVARIGEVGQLFAGPEEEPVVLVRDGEAYAVEVQPFLEGGASAGTSLAEGCAEAFMWYLKWWSVDQGMGS